MQTIQLTYPLPGDAGRDCPCGILAIGDFDGVHLGHREVIGRAVRRGAELGLPVSIMTFHPHPRQILGMDKYTKLLTPLSAKEEELERLGVKAVCVVDFNESFMRVTPQSFVEHMLLPLGVNTVFVGFDFTFGFKGAGTPDTLCELAQGRFAVEVVRPFQLDGQKVSSTQIRAALMSGQLSQASRLLGRPYRVRGTVVSGDGRGRTIGFPTANIDVSEAFVIPANGVYAVRVQVRDSWYGGVMNIGLKPTFGGDTLHPVLEAHIFDFSESIYGEHVEVELIEYIRPERKFSSVTELVEQIRMDAQQARELTASGDSVESS